MPPPPDRLLTRLVDHVAELERRLDAGGGYFSRHDVRIASLERLLEHQQTMLRLTQREVRALRRSWSYRVGRVAVFPASLLKRGLGWLARRSRDRADAGAGRLRAPSAAERERWTAAYRRLRSRPRISVVVPVHRAPTELLRAALDSVTGQVYGEWELCLADDASADAATERVLREFHERDPDRVRLVLLARRRGIAGASNAAAALASGEFLAFLDHDDLLTPDALLEMASRIERVADVDVLYSDEDKLEGTRLVEAHHKPGYSPEQLLSSNYLCHLTVIRRALFERLGGFREGFDGAQDHDLLLRAVERARRVEHVPRVLYHWRKTPGSTAASVGAKGGPWRESARAALRETVRRRGWRARVENGLAPGTYRVRFEVDPGAPVAIVIPTRDRADLLERCIDGIRRRTRHAAYEILVVSNRSVEERTRSWLDRAEARGALRWFAHDAPFNFAALNNLAARRCEAPFLLFMNNDLEVLDEGWLESLLEHAQREEIGAVGGKLCYPDGRVQHAGIALGLLGVAGHPHRGINGDAAGYFAQAAVVRDVSAVTGACLMTRRDVFERVGGFSEELAVAFNDVDYCLKVGAAGYRVIYTPYARLTHHESATRPRDDLSDARFRSEVAWLGARWGERLHGGDPFYNPNLTLWSEDLAPRGAGERERSREFAELYGAGRETSEATSVAVATAAAAPARREYRAVWDDLARDEVSARRHVTGSDDEDDFARSARRTVETLEATVGIGAAETVLEIGCGVGRVGALVAPRCGRWIGCDVSPNMLGHAARRLAGRPDVELVEVTGFDLRPVHDGSVDVVYCTVVFMHLDEWERYGYVAEAFRVLRGGGRLYVDNVNLRSDEGFGVFEQHRAMPPDRRPAHATRTSTPQELAAYLERARFRDVRCHESGAWVQCWGVK